MTTKTILILIPTFSQTIEQRICLGLREGLAGADVSTVFVPIGYLPSSTSQFQNWRWFHKRLLKLCPDLIVLYGGGLAYESSEAVYQALIDCYGDTPMLHLGMQDPSRYCVDVANYEGMLALMTSVVERKPKAPYLFISGPPDNADSQLRYQALCDALIAQGGNPGKQVTVLEGNFKPSRAVRLFTMYLASTPARERAEVVVCANDLTAKGVLDACHAQGLRCPENLWVTGYDDFEYAAVMEPGLTTVHYPAKEMGLKAAELSLSFLEDGSIPMLSEVPSYPVMRGSTDDANPGFGDYEQQLRKQWAMVQQRDNNARKLAVLRDFKRSIPLQTLLERVRDPLADLNVDQVTVFLHEKGVSAEEEASVRCVDDSGVSLLSNRDDRWLPEVFAQQGLGYTVLCPMALADDHYGCLVAQCDPVSAEFVEFMAPQVAELLHTEALEEKNEQYRVQNELNERMASLGSLVSGIAHEINTPIGTGKLAASSLKDLVEATQERVAAGTLKKSDFDNFLVESAETSQIIFQSLDRAAELISNFKLISVDQTAEAKRPIDLAEYIQSVLISLRHQFRGTPVELQVMLEEGVEVDTFPGALAQVVTNLVMNALKHGLDNATRKGTVTVSLAKTDDSHFVLQVADDGKGADEEVLRHAFDPFFTTARGAGGSGLGMHIVYNLVVQKLGWRVALASQPDAGFTTTITGRLLS